MVPQIDLLKRLVLSKFPVTIIQTEDAEQVIDLFKQLGEYEKKGFFYWHPEVGIHLLKNPSEPIANTQSLSSALTCIEQSQHFGHFLLRSEMCDAACQDGCVNTIQHILKTPQKSYRKVFIIGKQPNIPLHLKSKIIVIRLSTQYSGQVT